MTVEAAIALGSLVLLLGVILAGTGALVVRVRCVDAAGEAARLASRDDAVGARAAALRLLPSGAEVTIEPRGEEVRVRVRAPPLGGALPALRVGAEAVAVPEPAAAAPVAGVDVLPTGAAPTALAVPAPGPPP